MKLTDWLIEKIGSDKMLHFFIAGFFTALVSTMGWIAMIATTIVLFALAFIKEKYMDSVFDWFDIYYTLGGSVVVLLFNLLLLI